MSTSIDWNKDANHVIQWIRESEPIRFQYQRDLFRVRKAMMGRPSRNLYQEELQSNLRRLPQEEREKADKTGCTKVKEGTSFAIRKAVANRANQMASGVDTYEYQINDPYMIVDDDTEDLLAAQCEMDYVNNNLEGYSARISEDLTCAGVSAILVQYCPETDKNIVSRINPKNIWFDTMYSVTGCERFRGYSMMIPFKKVAKMIMDSKDEINTELEVPDRSIINKAGQLDTRIKVTNKKIKTINDLEIYIEDLNKIATSPQLQNGLSNFQEYYHDLYNCYNLGYYRTFATDAKARTESNYGGADVELTVMYDLKERVEYKILNRRFVISANRNAFRRNIAFPIYDPIADDTRYRIEEFHLDCPLKFKFAEMTNDLNDLGRPISPVMIYADLFDELCAWRSKRDHVAKILSILRIETNGADADSLRGILNLMGVVLDDIQGDINNIQFQYDWTAIDTQIQYLEQTIVEGLHAYDQFDAMQNMGDRASAAESGMAIGAVAEGLATHQNVIMSMYADIARQMIANRVAYSPLQEFPIYNHGGNESITIQQMALDAIVNVKPKLAKKVQERMLATNALTLLGTMKDTLTPEGAAFLMSQAMFGNAPRRMAASFIQQPGPSDQEIAANQLAAQNQAQMLQQNQDMYEQNPVPYEVDNIMQNQSPEDIDQIITGLNSSPEAQGQLSPELQGQEDAMLQGQMPDEATAQPVDMEQQDGAMSTNLEGQTMDSGSQMANPNGYM